MEAPNAGALPETLWNQWALEAIYAVLSTAAGVALRLQLPYRSCPWLIFKTLNEETYAGKIAVAARVWNTPECCRVPLPPL